MINQISIASNENILQNRYKPAPLYTTRRRILCSFLLKMYLTWLRTWVRNSAHIYYIRLFDRIYVKKWLFI